MCVSGDRGFLKALKSHGTIHGRRVLARYRPFCRLYSRTEARSRFSCFHPTTSSVPRHIPQSLHIAGPLFRVLTYPMAFCNSLIRTASRRISALHPAAQTAYRFHPVCRFAIEPNPNGPQIQLSQLGMLPRYFTTASRAGASPIRPFDATLSSIQRHFQAMPRAKCAGPAGTTRAPICLSL